MAGAQLPTLAELSENGLYSVLTWQIAVSFGLLSVFPFLTHWIVQRVRSRGAGGRAELRV